MIRYIKDKWWRIRHSNKFYRFERPWVIAWFWLTRPYWKFRHMMFTGHCDSFENATCSLDKLCAHAKCNGCTMTNDDWRKKTDLYIKSIGGLDNGFFGHFRPPITNAWFVYASPGWGRLIYELIVKIVAMGWNTQVTQVKEKYGGLRFYINGASREVHDEISAAERKSQEICEICGNPGELCTTGGWYNTFCETCRPSNFMTCKDYNEKYSCDKDISCSECPDKETCE